MSGQTQRALGNHLLVAALWLAVWPWLLAPCPGDQLLRLYRPPAWNLSAALHDLHMLDAQRGFAVGDHGLILHTQNGGRDWKQVYSGVSCELHAIQFLDDKHGWAVGGSMLPSLRPRIDRVGYEISQDSQGVILKTTDGGQSWKRVPTTALPLLTDIAMLSERRGHAVGVGNGLQPSGVFETSDGGISWSSAVTEQTMGWQSLASNRDRTAIVGLRSELAEVQGGQVKPAQSLVPHQLMLHAIHFDKRGRGFAVGNQGALLVSNSIREPWRYHSHQALTSDFDIHAVGTFEDDVFLAGSPGSRIHCWHTDSDQWQVLETGQALPIKRVQFVDANHGWALCSLGRILATRDGGQSWSIQRDPPSASPPTAASAGNSQGHAHSLGVLCVVNDVRQIPLELLGRYSAEEGYLTAVVVVASREDAHPLAAHHACSRLGNGELFWLDPTNLPANSTSAATSNSSPRQRWVAKCLTEIIRSTRPLAVVSGSNPAVVDRDQLGLNETIAAAVRLAANPELAAEARLPAWRVPRTYKRIDRPDLASVFVAETQYLAGNGSLLSDFLGLSRSLLGIPVAERHDSALLIVDAAAANGLSSNLLFDPDHPQLWKRQMKGGVGRIDSMKTAMRKQQMLKELMQWGFLPPAAESELALAQHQRTWTLKMEKMMQQLDPQYAGLWLYQLAEMCWENGDGHSYAAALETLAAKYPEHYLATMAQMDLLRFQASSEAFLASRQAWLARPQPAGSASPAQNVRQVSYDATPQISRTGNTTRIQFVPPDDAAPTHSPPDLEPREENRLARAQQLAHWLGSQGAINNEPLFSMSRAVLQRKTAGLAANSSPFANVARSSSASAVLRYAARREQQLLDPERSIGDTSILQASWASTAPQLDGSLDESFWQQLNLQLANDTAHPVEIRFANDSQYLYLGIRAAKLERARYRESAEVRQRDADLQSRDRLAIQLDTDRDYQSWFELVIDYRGWAADGLVLGHHGQANPHWDPTWYIAQTSDEHSWTVEAAIPLSEIVSAHALAQLRQTGQDRMVWAMAIKRVTPQTDNTEWVWRWPDAGQPVEQFPLGLLQLDLAGPESGVAPARPSEFPADAPATLPAQGPVARAQAPPGRDTQPRQ